MAIEQEIIEDHLKDSFILKSNVRKTDLVMGFREGDFYSEIYKQMAFMLADKIFKQISPAIDKALKESFLEPDNTEKTE
jgi:hypothetical protein